MQQQKFIPNYKLLTQITSITIAVNTGPKNCFVENKRALGAVG